MDANFYIFRNTTVEPLFNGIKGCAFSGYNDIKYKKGFSYYLWFYLLPLKMNSNALADEIGFIGSKLEQLIVEIPSTSFLLCITLEDLLPFQFIGSDHKLEETITKYNEHLFRLAENHPQIKTICFKEFAVNYRKGEIIDWRHYYLSQVVINPKLSTDFQNWFLKKVNAIIGIRKKCLVVDLDNTLWGGVLGEDGVAGLQLGNTYPGNCYYDLQAFIKEMKNNGIILAINSKNNERDVLEAFEQRMEMQLRMDDFAITKINWKDKPDNLFEIAEELNINPDSMVFLDDNPVERELMQQMFPEVATPDFPKQPYQLKEFISRVYNDYFQIYTLTSEDLSKTEQYKKNADRNFEHKKISTKEGFIKQLEIKMQLMEANELRIPRIAQMTQKTNQFNLTTKRYTETDIGVLLQKGYRIWCASVKDKFGDHGITTLAIVSISGDIAEIDSLLLSCRILGYGIEKTFLYSILKMLRDEGVKTVYASYIPTIKNRQTENFYEQSGFELVKIGKTGINKYVKYLNTKLIV